MGAAASSELHERRGVELDDRARVGDLEVAQHLRMDDADETDLLAVEEDVEPLRGQKDGVCGGEVTREWGAW